MTALIYVRVSTEEQVKHGYSLSAQEDACRKKARELGADKLLVFEDKGITGSVLERPGLQSALQAVKEPECRLFIIYDPDRLSRKLAHQLMLVDTIEKNGCRLEFINFDWQDTPEGRLFYSMRGAVSEYEKEKFRARSRFGKLAKARKGFFTHDPGIYGYRYVPEKNTLDVEKEEADVYYYMVEMALYGASAEKIALRLNEKGISGPRGKTWYRSTVRRILKNPSYAGIVYLNKYNASGVKAARAAGSANSYSMRPQEEWIPVSIPRLISPEKWQQLQYQQKVAKKGNRGKHIYTYLLSGLLFCGTCGSFMHGIHTKKACGKIYRYYVCSKRYGYKKNEKKCNMFLVNAGDLEEKIWNSIYNLLNDPPAMTGDVQGPQFLKNLQNQEHVLRKQQRDLNREWERIVTAYRKGLLNIQQFQKEKINITGRQKNIEDKCLEIEQMLHNSRKQQDNEYQSEQVINNMYLLDNNDKKYLIRLLVEKVIVTFEQEIIIEMNCCLPGNQ